jgi:hypothetical protein
MFQDFLPDSMPGTVCLIGHLLELISLIQYNYPFSPLFYWCILILIFLRQAELYCGGGLRPGAGPPSSKCLAPGSLGFHLEAYMAYAPSIQRHNIGTSFFF